jgi:hypothetical protein
MVARRQPTKVTTMRWLYGLLALAVLATPAKAVIVNSGDVGFTGVTGIQGQIGGVNQPGLTGLLGLTYTGLSNGGLTYNFAYVVSNTSSAPITASRISSFAFETNPNITAAASTGVYNDPNLPANGYPGFLPGTVEFCFGNQANTCEGGGGLTIGQSSGGTFALTFSSVLASIDLQTAYFRFQSIVGGTGGDSGAGFNHDIVVTNPNLVDNTPVPGAVWLFGSIVAGAGALRTINRRRNKRAGVVS